MSPEILALSPPSLLDLAGNLLLGLLMVQLIFGAVVCFCGYQILRFLIGLSGFVLGAGICGLIAAVMSGEEWIAAVAALLGGVGGAMLALALYYVGIFLIGAGLGATLAVVGALVMDVEPYLPIVLLLAVATGVGALFAQKLFVVLSTALGGAWNMTTAAFALFGLLDWSAILLGVGGGQLVLLIATWLFVALLGALVQYRLLGALVAGVTGGRRPVGPPGAELPAGAPGLATGHEAAARPATSIGAPAALAGSAPAVAAWFGRVGASAREAWSWLREKLAAAAGNLASSFRRDRARPRGVTPLASERGGVQPHLAARREPPPAFRRESPPPSRGEQPRRERPPQSGGEDSQRRRLVLALLCAVIGCGILLLIVAVAGSGGDAGQLLAIAVLLGLIALVVAGLVIAVRGRHGGSGSESLLARITGPPRRGSTGEDHR